MTSLSTLRKIPSLGIRQAALYSWPAVACSGLHTSSRHGQQKAEAVAKTTDSQVAGRPFAELPGPKGLPLIGTMLEAFIRSGGPFNQSKMHTFFASRAQKYGPIYREKAGNMDVVVLSDADGIRDLCRSEPKYPQRFEFRPMKWYKEHNSYPLGVFMANGEEWHKHRSPLNRHLLRPKQVASYTEDLNGVMDDFMGVLSQGREANGHVTALDDKLFRWALESASFILFDRRLGCLDPTPDPGITAFIQALKDELATLEMFLVVPYEVAKLLHLPVWTKFVKSLDIAHATARKYVTEQIDSIERSLEAGEEVSTSLTAALVQGDTLTKEEILASILDLMGAAIDTTSNTVIWILHNLARHPDKQHTLYEEVARVLPSNGLPNEDSINELHYLKAVLRESMRLYPTAPMFSRLTTEDMAIKGYTIPKSTNVLLNIWALGRDPETYRDPEAFVPERWLRGSKEKEAETIDPFSAVPFGFGVRQCIGRRLAELEIYLMVSRLVHKFEIRPLDPSDDVKPINRFLLVPEKPIRFTFTPRAMTSYAEV